MRQFFMRDYGEESSLLARLTEHLSHFDVLITYNGKTYDLPLLETRYRMARAKPPFARLAHLDLLHGARRLWKLRLDSCRLVDLENQILGLEREGRSAGRNDSVLLLPIPAHATSLPAGADLPSQRDGYRFARLPDRDGPIRVPLAGGRGAAAWRGPGGLGALAGASRAV